MPNSRKHNPKNSQYLRNANRAAIIRRLATNGMATRADLADSLHLTKMAISTIVSEMLETNLLMECGIINEKAPQASGSNSGRKPTALTIPDCRLNAIGLFIMRYQVTGIAIDIKGNCFFLESVPIPENTDNDRFAEIMIDLTDKIIRENRHIEFTGIGIASIGPVDIYHQMILNPPNFRNIKDIAIGRMIRDHFKLPVFLDNDMNAGALAESLYGSAKGMTDIVYLGLGSGVGVGVITGGHMLHGNGGYAGEMGHMSIQMDGPLCSCGRRGCLELYTNTFTLLTNAGMDTLDALIEAAAQDPMPPLVQSSIDRYMSAVLSGLTTIANTFDPEIIIIGDDGARMAPFFVEKLEREMNDQMFQRETRKISLTVSSFHKNAPLVGAGALVFQRIFNGDMPV